MNGQQRRRRRPPSLYALVIVVAMTCIGVGLFVWGPVNPRLTATGIEQEAPGWIDAMLANRGSFGSGQPIEPDGHAESALVIQNHSFAAVELESVRVVADAASAAPTIVGTRGVPARLTKGETADVTVTVDARTACATTHGGDVEYQVLVDARTASGVVPTIGREGRYTVSCRSAALPPPGKAPADAPAARAAIDHAFATAYDFSAPADRREAAVDEPTGLAPAIREVADGPYGGIMRSTGVRIVSIVFTSPTRAAVLYDLTGVPDTFGTDRLGSARLVDGHWKVTRATVCADLALAQVTCPSG